MFSDREEKILKIIGRKKTTITEITKELFKNEKVFDSEVRTGNSIRRIILKCEFNNLDWTLTKTRENNKLYIKKEKV